MNEIRDAKYFGARIGEKCWIAEKPFAITAVRYITNQDFIVTVFDGDPSIQADIDIKNGEVITFEPPKKKVQKEIDCFVYESTMYQEYEKYSVYWNREARCPEYRDKLIPAKLTFETWE